MPPRARREAYNCRFARTVQIIMTRRCPSEVMRHGTDHRAVPFKWKWLLGFSENATERGYTRHRQLVMAPIVRLWALFGTAAVLATLARREYTQWDMNIGLLGQALRFLALRLVAGNLSSLENVIHVASFPLRATVLVISCIHFKAVGHSVSQVLPLFALYDAVLYPCIEQVGHWLGHLRKTRC